MQGIYPDGLYFDLSKVRFPLKTVDRIRALWEVHNRALWVDFGKDKEGFWEIDERNIELYTSIPKSEFIEDEDLAPGDTWTPEGEGFVKIDESWFKALTHLAMED